MRAKKQVSFDKAVVGRNIFKVIMSLLKAVIAVYFAITTFMELENNSLLNKISFIFSIIMFIFALLSFIIGVVKISKAKKKIDTKLNK